MILAAVFLIGGPALSQEAAKVSSDKARLSDLMARLRIQNFQGTEIPPFALPDTNGKKVSISAFKGKVLILNFWTTW